MKTIVFVVTKIPFMALTKVKFLLFPSELYPTYVQITSTASIRRIVNVAQLQVAQAHPLPYFFYA